MSEGIVASVLTGLFRRRRSVDVTPTDAGVESVDRSGTSLDWLPTPSADLGPAQLSLPPGRQPRGSADYRRWQSLEYRPRVARDVTLR